MHRAQRLASLLRAASAAGRPAHVGLLAEPLELALASRAVTCGSSSSALTHTRLSQATPPPAKARPYSAGASDAVPAPTPPPQLSEAEYNKLADNTLHDLLDKFEVLLDDIDLEDGEVDYSSGVLTVKLGGLGTYVINKQTPNRQIWLSSPVSGPFRYDYRVGRWLYHRDGHELHTRLSSEIKALTGAELDASACGSCEKLGSCVGDVYCLKEKE